MTTRSLSRVLFLYFTSVLFFTWLPVLPLAATLSQTSPDDIMIAALLPIERTHYPFSLMRVRAAVDLALEEIAHQGVTESAKPPSSQQNHRHSSTRHPHHPTGRASSHAVPQLPGRRLTVGYRDSQCDEAHGMDEAIKFYVDSPAHVFLGPVCDLCAAPVIRQANQWNRAVITTGALALDFTQRKLTAYPTMTRVGPANFGDLSKALFAVMARFSWSQVFILYDREGRSDEVMPIFCHLVAETFIYGGKGSAEKAVSMDRHKLEPTVDGGWETLDWAKALVEKIGRKFAGKSKLSNNYVTNFRCLRCYQIEADAVPVVPFLQDVAI